MHKTVLIAAALAAGVGLTACSEKTQDEMGQAAESAGNDISTATDHAGAKIEEGTASAGQAIENAGRDIGAAADHADDKIAEGAKNAKRETGEELEKAGKDIQQ